MKRQTINVYSPIKQRFNDLKNSLGLSESETVAYLVQLHELYEDKLTKKQHDEFINKVEEMHKQSTL